MINQYNFLTTWLKAHTKSERGAAMVEYALLVALIAIAQSLLCRYSVARSPATSTTSARRSATLRLYRPTL